jgi:hypothetical protein
VTLALLVLAPAAEANFVYWTSGSPGSSIARAKLNGTALNTSFIAGLGDPNAVAIDSRFIYWTQGDATTGSIGRADLDGSGANQEFIPHTAGVSDPSGIAVTPTAIYWQNGGGGIARANIDGTGVNTTFIPTTDSTCGLTSDSSFLYFLDNGGAQIGRAGLDGSSVSPAFAATSQAFCGLSLDVNYLYWATGTGNSVGRVPLVGGAPEPDFIEDGSAGGGTGGVAVNPQFVFWSNYGTDAIGRAAVNGSGRNPTLIGSAGVSGPANPSQLAVAPSNKISLVSVTIDRKRGTASVIARVQGPGHVSIDEAGTQPDAGASAAAIEASGMDLPRAETFELIVRASGKTARKMKKRVLRKGKAGATVNAFIHFLPAGVAGVPNSLPVSVRLIKKGRRQHHRK